MRNTSYTKKGFTLIELIVVFSITTILSTIGVASFVSYSRQEAVTTGTAELKTMLNRAKSLTLSQVKPNQCSSTQQFNGYKVLVCCSSGNLCPQPCQLSGSYELQVVCANNPVAIDMRNLPKQVTVDTGLSNTTSRSFWFQPITAAVIGAGKIMINGVGYNKTQTLTVSSTGIIQ